MSLHASLWSAVPRQNPNNPSEGWGIFGQIGFTDSNPTQYRVMGFAGIAGTSPIAGRSLDRFGVVYHHTAFSRDLSRSLQLLGLDLGDAYGVEQFYNAAVTPWWHVAADLQYIRPGDQSLCCAFFAGVSVQIKF